jgi:hypothetical protein
MVKAYIAVGVGVEWKPRRVALEVVERYVEAMVKRRWRTLGGEGSKMRQGG